MIQAVIFDIGGVVIPLRDIISPLASFLKVDDQELRQAFKNNLPIFATNKCTEIEFWQMTGKALGINVPRDYRKLWWLSPENPSMYWQVIHLIATLRQQGFRIAAFSNVIKPFSEYGYRTGLYAHFDPCVLSNETGYYKPDVKGFQFTLGQLHLDADQVLFIDDDPHNLKPAQNLGMYTIHASSPSIVVKKVKALLKIDSQ